MNQTSDSRPAFPFGDAPGMSLRDYFAAAAMPMLIRNWGGFGLGDAQDAPLNGMAQAAYLFADAMLAERKKK